MKKRRLIITLVAVITIAGLPGLLSAGGINAAQVIKEWDTREDGDTVTSDTLMVLINKANNKRVRNIKNIRKDFGPDSKGIIFFTSPADVRNTAYMSFDWDDPSKEDDSWLYLPALQKVKRVAAGDKSGSFMGSDFTYSDINGMEIENWDYTFARENAMFEDHEVWIIKGLPKPSAKKKVLEETGYLKSLMWIRKDNFMLVKGKYWVKEGKKIKFFKAEDIKKVDNIWTAHTLTMVTTVKGKVEHSSVLKFSNVAYNVPVDDDAFTTRMMERGL
jgi:hypothetical protein